MVNQSFGECLRELREKQGISMRSLATSADMDPAYLSRIENGKSGAPRHETVEKLGQALCAEQGLATDACEALKRRLLIAAGLLQDKEELIDDLAERFAARLRDEGFPEARIDEAIARVSLPTMRAVLMGEEKLEIGNAADYSSAELWSRSAAGEDIEAFGMESFAIEPSDIEPSDIESFAMQIDAPEPLEEPVETYPLIRTKMSRKLPDSAKPRPEDSAASYLSRHAEEFATRRRRQRVQSRAAKTKTIRAGRDAVISINKDITREQEQQLRLIARLISSLLEK